MSIDRRGMSLLEMMVVIALIGIIGSLAVTNFASMRRRGALRESSLLLANDLGRARTLAISARSDFIGFAASDKVVEAGVRFVGPTRYEVFVDRDDQADGNEVTVAGVDLPHRGFPVALDSPPAEVRFRKDGTLKDSVETRVVVHDTENSQRRVLVISLGGKAKVTE